MSKKRNFRLTKFDANLLGYLHASKVANTSQIMRDVYHTQSGPNTRKRLKFMKDAKIITALKPVGEATKCYEYSLTPEGFKIAKRFIPYEVESKRIKSDSVEHDLHLFDIKNLFLRKDLVAQYYSENQIQSYVCLKMKNSSHLRN